MNAVRWADGKINGFVSYGSKWIVIGWSVPNTDRQQCELVREALRLRANALEKLTVVTFGATDEYFGRVVQLISISENAIERHNRGFVEFVTDGDNCCRQVSNWFRRFAN
ncbi:MAG: hypothetical protein ACT4QD_11225 [Acidobacteriota bacterium]